MLIITHVQSLVCVCIIQCIKINKQNIVIVLPYWEKGKELPSFPLLQNIEPHYSCLLWTLHVSGLYFICILSLLLLLTNTGTNKLLFLQKGIIDDVITVLNQSDEPNVVIKAIGCLRILSSETGMISRFAYNIDNSCDICTLKVWELTHKTVYMYIWSTEQMKNYPFLMPKTFFMLHW